VLLHLRYIHTWSVAKGSDRRNSRIDICPDLSHLICYRCPLHLEKVYAVRRPREHSANKCVKVRRTITCTELFSLDQASRTDEIELQLAKELLNPQVTLGPSENRIEIGCTQDFRRTPTAGIGSVNIEQVHKGSLIWW